MLDELERLEKAATPGPWAIHTDLRKWVMNDDPCAEWGINRDNDAAFVAAARNALPTLLRVARAAEAFNRTFGAHLAPYLRDTGLGAVAAEFAAALADFDKEAP